MRLILKIIANNGVLLLLGYIIFFGIFGILQKYTSNNLTWQTHMAYVWISALIFNIIFVFKDANWQFNKFTLITIFLGFLASLGTVCMYKALKLEKLSKVHVLSSFVFILPVLASFIIYHEPFTIKKGLAIFFSIIAILLINI